MHALELKNVRKTYSGPPEVHALSDISLNIEVGAFLAIIGPSGSGKTTLLNLASGLDVPSSGQILINGTSLSGMSQTELCEFRSYNIGFIFQSYNLFPVLTTVENVEFTSILRGDFSSTARKLALEALEAVGLSDKINALPSQLSGGQQQRVAVARALAMQPKIIFADEPTANLDSKTSQELIDLFKLMNQKLGVTFIFSTHDLALIDQISTKIRIHDGRVL